MKLFPSYHRESFILEVSNYHKINNMSQLSVQMNDYTNWETYILLPQVG